jgi:hypothetical protein
MPHYVAMAEDAGPEKAVGQIKVPAMYFRLP